MRYSPPAGRIALRSWASSETLRPRYSVRSTASAADSFSRTSSTTATFVGRGFSICSHLLRSFVVALGDTPAENDDGALACRANTPWRTSWSSPRQAGPRTASVREHTGCLRRARSVVDREGYGSTLGGYKSVAADERFPTGRRHADFTRIEPFPPSLDGRPDDAVTSPL